MVGYMKKIEEEIIKRAGIFTSINSREGIEKIPDVSICESYSFEGEDKDIIEISKQFSKEIDSQIIDYLKEQIPVQSIKCSKANWNLDYADDDGLIDSLFPDRIDEHKIMYYPYDAQINGKSKYFFTQSQMCSMDLKNQNTPYLVVFFNYKSYFAYELKIEHTIKDDIKICASFLFDVPLASEVIKIHIN